MKKIKTRQGWIPESALRNDYAASYSVFTKPEDAQFLAGFGEIIEVKITPVKRRKK